MNVVEGDSESNSIWLATDLKKILPGKLFPGNIILRLVNSNKSFFWSH